MTRLAKIGIQTVVPTIRSSDLNGIHNPLVYFLSRRCQLVPQLSWNEALHKGSWVHYVFESPSHNDFLCKLGVRLSELCDLASSMGIGEEGLDKLLGREKRDALTAWSWVEAWKSVQISPKHGTILDVKQRLGQSLGREILVVQNFLETVRVAQIDELFYDEKSGRLWLWDDKTTSVSPIERLASCSREVQCVHYLSTSREMLPDICEHFGLPKDTKLAGMVHAAYQKPDLKFGTGDRNFREIEFTPTRGKNKGVTRIEKEYYGDPVPENYVARTCRWLKGTDEYEHLARSRDGDPCVNVSTTFTDMLDPLAKGWYDARLSMCYDMATCPADPVDFPPVLYDMARSPYKPFALTNIDQWPSIIAAEHFVRKSRDRADLNPGVYRLAQPPQPVDARDHPEGDQAETGSPTHSGG